MQGRFKRPVPAADLMMGQEFVKASQAPPWVAEIVFTAAAKAMSNSTQVRIPSFIYYVLDLWIDRL